MLLKIKLIYCRYEKGKARNLGYRTIVLLLLLIGLSNTLFYGYKLRAIPYRTWTKEQLLVMQYSIAAVLDANPVSAILIWSSQVSPGYITLAGVIDSIAVPWLFTLTLLLIDGLRVDVYPKFKERPSFYLFKVAFAFSLGIIL